MKLLDKKKEYSCYDASYVENAIDDKNKLTDVISDEFDNRLVLTDDLIDEYIDDVELREKLHILFTQNQFVNDTLCIINYL